MLSKSLAVVVVVVALCISESSASTATKPGVRTCFRTFDTDGDSFISTKELKAAMLPFKSILGYSADGISKLASRMGDYAKALSGGREVNIDVSLFHKLINEDFQNPG